MPSYWLLKTEPGTYSYTDLERERRAVWDGVANPLALKHLRAMRKGDLVFIYHTGNEKQIVGIAEVVREGEEPQLEAKQQLLKPVTLANVKARKEFADFELVRMGRLSVMPVSVARWNWLCKLAGCGDAH